MVAKQWHMLETTKVLWSSPLIRAVETARIMFGQEPRIHPSLTEMDWGKWEGRKLEPLRQELGKAMAANEARGLDMRPEGGESPRDVQKRINQWFSLLNQERHKVHVAITHKGVIRAAISLATGWDMTEKAPVRLVSSCAYKFLLKSDRDIVFESVIPLKEKPKA